MAAQLAYRRSVFEGVRKVGILTTLHDRKIFICMLVALLKKTGSFASCVETIVVAPREPTVEPPRNPCPYNNVNKYMENSEDFKQIFIKKNP